ncbi:hypothetical protein Tco_1294433 [Tanacetum coccineum]
MKKCYTEEPLAVLLKGFHIKNKLHFIEEPTEIMDQEVKRLKESRVPIVKVRWNSRRGPEFTWEREDQFRKKYPHLFTKTASSSSVDRAQSSRVRVPLLDDPYVAVRQAWLVDTESEPEEAPFEAEGLQSLGSRVPLMSEEFEAIELSGTRTDSSHSSASSDSTTPLSPDHPLTNVLPTPTPTRASFHRRTARMAVRAQPAMSPGLSASVTEAMALLDSAFRDKLGDEDIKEDESLDADDEREMFDDEGHGSNDEGHGLEGEEFGLEEEEVAAPEGQQQAFLVVDTAASEPLGLRYRAARHRAPEPIEEIAPSTYEVDPEDERVYINIPVYPPVAPVQTSLSPEWSSGSLPVSSSSPVVPSPIASLVATLTATISVDKDQFLEVGAQLELHRIILYNHTQCLDALPPTLFVDINKDVRELYTRSGVVRDEIFSQRYRFRSLEREQERTVVTFRALWRPVLALEAWAGHVDTRMADMSRAGYDDHRLIYDMLVQQVALQRELQEMRGRVAALEQERGRREP